MSIESAITHVKNSYAKAIEEKHNAFICKLTNNNEGFNYEEIEAIKCAISYLEFFIPTHISILPKGKKQTSSKLFDGMQTIYSKEKNKCNKH